MDYFSTFIQMLHAKKLSANTIRVYSSYIKPYLAFLDGLHVSPEQASYQTMRDFLDAIQAERGLSDRTINMIISYLQFFQMYVLHKDWDKTQIPFRAFNTFLPFVPSPAEVRRFLCAVDKLKVKLAVSMLDKTQVTFSARPLEPGNPRRIITLSNTEFIRRYLMHVLPPGFQKIRYYGFLNNRGKTKNLKLIFTLQGHQRFKARYIGLTIAELLKAVWNVDISICPVCGCHRMCSLGRMHGSS